MKTLIFALVLSTGLLAQSPDRKLNATLLGMRNNTGADLRRQLTDEILSLSKVDRPDVESFAGELTGALLGRTLTPDQLEGIRSAILDNLRTSGSNYSPAYRLQINLAEVGVSADTIQRTMTPFIRIGETLRGPDDPPVYPER